MRPFTGSRPRKKKQIPGGGLPRKAKAIPHEVKTVGGEPVGRKKRVPTTEELLGREPLQRVPVSLPAGNFEVFVWKGGHTRVFRVDSKGRLVEETGGILESVYKRFGGMIKRK